MQQRIQIPRNGIKLAGVLFTPENFDETKQYPAIVVVHPGGGVKEQTAGLYAGKLAEADFVAVAYDTSHQGDTAYQAESILERAASAKKELVRIAGATHVSLYDKDADKAVEKLAVFFKENR